MRKVSSSCRIERKQKANICLRRDKESPYRLCVKWITTARHCRDCKSTVVVHSGADFQPAGNKRNRKAGDPALLQGSLCDPRKSAFGTCTLLRKVPFSLWRKVPPVPLLREAGTNLHLLQEEGGAFLFQGKKKRMFLLYCDKRNQKHRKGKEASPSLFKPIPFDKWGQSSLSGMRKVSSGYRRDGKQRTIVCLR